MYRTSGNFKNSKLFLVAAPVLWGTAATILCLVIFSFVMTKADAPDGIISAMASISLCVGSYFASFLISKKRRKNGLLTGILFGMAVFGLLFLINLVFLGDFNAGFAVSKLAMLVTCSGIGGIVGVNSKIKRY
ncbi:MAG: TIGR04086 family membrane protein [Oscillospiraceae bacterium]|nr:TIGR04086 family membrane protein [Oscillospiraceae bacterium]